MNGLPTELIWSILKLLPEPKLIVIRLVSRKFCAVSTDIIERRLPYPLSQSIWSTGDDVYTYLLKCCNKGYLLSLKYILDEIQGDNARILSYFPAMSIVWGQCMLEACKSGHAEIVKLMIRFGSNMCLMEGLRTASYKGYYETVRVLVDNGYMVQQNLLNDVLDYIESSPQSSDPRVDYRMVLNIIFHVSEK